MTDKSSSSALLNLSQAERAAGQRPRQDIDSLVATCPASQGKLFVVPTRYALAEYPADHASCQPGVEPQSHPMAVRRLREGFLYLWQSPGPLQRFAICPQGMLEPQPLTDDDTITLNGSLTGLALDKHSPAWLMYAEYPLNARSCEALNDPGTRQKRMRRLDLPQVANHLSAAHCPPLEAAEQVIAELMPQTYHWGVVSDHQLNGDAEYKKAEQLKEQMFANPTAETSKAWTDAMYWVGERDRIASKHADAPQGRPAPGQWSAAAWQPLHTRKWLDSARQEAAECWAVFACLDDDLGVLRDIDRDQSQFEDAHQQWVSDNQIRLTVGGFIRSLMTEDGAELADRINYRFKEEKLKITPEQGNTLLKIHERLDPLRFEESRLANASAVLITPEGKQKLASLKEEISLLKKPVNNFIPVKLQKDVEIETRVYRQHKSHNQRSGKFSGKIGEYIDLSTMNNWLDVTAPDHYKSVDLRHKQLYADREVFLLRHESGTWFVDFDDEASRDWLTGLARDCLTSQCLTLFGAEQYAHYVRSQDKGALRQLLFSWSPSLEAALHNETRLGEIMAALSGENLNNTKDALSKALGPAANKTLNYMQKVTNNSLWILMINRLSPAILMLQGKAERLSESWVGLMTFLHINAKARLKWTQGKSFKVLEIFGPGTDDLKQWTKTTANAIAKGKIADIVNNKAVQNAGGLTPLIILMLNIFNTERYLSQAGPLENMDKRRTYETISATFYTAAALTAVIENVARQGYGVNQFGKSPSPILTRPLFGALISSLSAVAAFTEFKSLSIQIEESQNSIDPWLELRKTVTGAQTITYTAQALIGANFTYAVVSGAMPIGAAIKGFSIMIAPLILITAVLGVIYLAAWFFQQTPLQNFLHHSFWSIQRAKNLSPPDQKAQQEELSKLLILLYTPRIIIKVVARSIHSGGRLGGRIEKFIESLCIDLPGATPAAAELEISLIGNPLDQNTWIDLIDDPESSSRNKTYDLGKYWLANTQCAWIPHREGQGLRLKGDFKYGLGKFASLPSQLSICVKYKPPIAGLLGIDQFIGGGSGLLYSITSDDGIIQLRDGEAPRLNTAQTHTLSAEQFSKLLNTPPNS
ncbi:hypothetical protein NRB16_23675 [Pseudomonas sp. LJDD11]|nr:toxin VasX [Pseudomonas sp. LJDD11]MCQ9426526.1 hypothetical protein [Pseudomonas sp. LJDD11]